MRISDWSSDVCSSDLCASRDTQPAACNAAASMCGLPWLHADRAVEAHGLAVEVAVADHFQRQACVFFRRAETRWERHHRAKRFEHFRRCASHCRRIEDAGLDRVYRSEEHTSELQSLMRISYAVFCLK